MVSFLYFIYNFTDVKYYNWKFVGLTHPSKTINESRERKIFLKSYQCRIDFKEKNSGIKVEESWLENTKIYPKFLGTETIIRNKNYQYTLVLKFSAKSFSNMNLNWSLFPIYYKNWGRLYYDESKYFSFDKIDIKHKIFTVLTDENIDTLRMLIVVEKESIIKQKNIPKYDTIGYLFLENK